MKKILLGLLLVVCAGCTTVYIPAYVQDVNPYKKRFYANHDRSLAATMQALNETGWEIEGRMDPAIYEKIRNKYSLVSDYGYNLFTGHRTRIDDIRPQFI